MFLPDKCRSRSTSWRQLNQWEEVGAWLRALHRGCLTLNEKGLQRWDEDFLDEGFATTGKWCAAVGKTGRGEDTTWMRLRSGEGVPLQSASPAEAVRSVHESRAAGRSRRLPTRYASLREVRSAAQALKYGAKQCAIRAALNPDRCASQELDENRA